ncbi:MFS transporter [Undibacterium parvum]|uniref:MFS transporter n=1 Tax=Undibacterium parvum TaxID=401471 RepID=A0A3S9HP04_9BURK|nr:MFS transporter [Undibacterium parvum]AZP13848.1 MFS transporter [Undibacterium parvum]
MNDTTKAIHSKQAEAAKQNDKPRLALFRDTNFRWMISGGVISMLGDQFTIVALPWLVLKMTGDTLILGLVLALIGVPRALLILLGGAVVDRYSPKQVMMLSKYVNTVVLGLLAVLLMSDSLSLNVVYVLSLSLGISTAFSIPSGTAMIPRCIAAPQLQMANGIMLGLRQISMFLGPLLAGVLIALFGNTATDMTSASSLADARGLAAAFLFDSFSYALSAWTLSHVRLLALPQLELAGEGENAHPKPAARLWHSILEGLRYCWNDVMLRTCFLYWSAVAFFIMGPIQIALPVLANQLGDSAGTFGILIGCHGAGTLLGMLMSGLLPNRRFGNLGRTILLIDFIVGLLFVPMSLVVATWQGAALLLTIGTLGGYLHVAVYTWIQRQVPAAMLGRTMSIFMFIFMGIGPVSAAITGWVMRSISTSQLFIGSGALLILIVLLALLGSSMRSVVDQPA